MFGITQFTHTQQSLLRLSLEQDLKHEKFVAQAVTKLAEFDMYEEHVNKVHCGASDCSTVDGDTSCSAGEDSESSDASSAPSLGQSHGDTVHFGIANDEEEATLTDIMEMCQLVEPTIKALIYEVAKLETAGKMTQTKTVRHRDGRPPHGFSEKAWEKVHEKTSFCHEHASHLLEDLGTTMTNIKARNIQVPRNRKTFGIAVEKVKSRVTTCHKQQIRELKAEAEACCNCMSWLWSKLPQCFSRS